MQNQNNNVEDDSHSQKWQEVQEYIETNGKSPSPYDRDAQVKTLGKWISHNKNSYKKYTDPNTREQSQDMMDDSHRQRWEAFVETNNDFFMSYADEEVQYYDELPSQRDRDAQDMMDDSYRQRWEAFVETLGTWISQNQGNYSMEFFISDSEPEYDM